MSLLQTAGFIVVDIVVVGATWIAVMRNDRRRDEVDETLWVRSIEEYRARAQARRIRRPIPIRQQH